RWSVLLESSFSWTAAPHALLCVVLHAPSAANSTTPAIPWVIALGIRELLPTERVGFGRAGRIGAPVRPRTGVKAGERKACQLHSQCIVASGDARAAVDDDFRVGVGVEASSQLAGRQEASGFVDVARPGSVDGSRDVARSRINRFDVSAVSLGCAG